MLNKIVLAGVIMLLLVALPAVAADVTGKWVAESQGMQGATQTTFTFKAQGTTLTGTVSGRGGDTEISEGKINGDEISFVVVRVMGENEMKTLWKGKVSGKEITFTREFQGAPGGMMGGPGGGMGGPPGGGMGAPPAGGMGGPGGGMGGPGGGMGGPGGGMGGSQEIIAKKVE